MGAKRILYVEDERIFALEMRYILEGLGYTVAASVATGEEAIEMLHEHSPDIVMMDIKLGGKLDGIDAAKLIRKTNPSIPLIYITGIVDERLEESMAATAPYQLIRKPIDEQKLAEALKQVLQ